MAAPDRTAGQDRGSDLDRLGPMAFGAAPLGNSDSVVRDEDCRATVNEALRVGIAYFDTAPMYGHGLSEHRLGAALREVPRDAYILSTKVGRMLRPSRCPKPSGYYVEPLPFDMHFDYSFDGVLRSVEDSLQRLGMAHFDIVYVHDIAPMWHGNDLEDHLRIFLDGGYRALARLKEEKVISALGVGINHADTLLRLARAAKFDVFMLAGEHTLINQHGGQELLPFCLEAGIGVVVAAPFAGGILASDRGGAKRRSAPVDIVSKVDSLERICAQHAVPLAAAALQYPLRHSAVRAVATGFRSPVEVRRAIELMRLPIPDALWSDMRMKGLIRAE